MQRDQSSMKTPKVNFIFLFAQVNEKKSTFNLHSHLYLYLYLYLLMSIKRNLHCTCIPKLDPEAFLFSSSWKDIKYLSFLQKLERHNVIIHICQTLYRGYVRSQRNPLKYPFVLLLLINWKQTNSRKKYSFVTEIGCYGDKFHL